MTMNLAVVVEVIFAGLVDDANHAVLLRVRIVERRWVNLLRLKRDWVVGVSDADAKRLSSVHVNRGNV